MQETIVHFTPKSKNAKTGAIPVTTSAPNTCPDSCPLKAGGCYAKGGPLGMHWRKVGAGRGGSWDALCDSIAALPEGQVWRHNQAGDLPGEGEAINAAELATLVDANRGRNGFTYTHKPVLDGDRWGDADALSVVRDNRGYIAYANANGFTINLSANDLAHADALAALDIGPVAVVLDAAHSGNTETPAGRKVVQCPATARDDITCAKCKLCASNKPGRPIVGFPAHGASKRKASAVAAGK